VNDGDRTTSIDTRATTNVMATGGKICQSTLHKQTRTVVVTSHDSLMRCPSFSCAAVCMRVSTCQYRCIAGGAAWSSLDQLEADAPHLPGYLGIPPHVNEPYCSNDVSPVARQVGAVLTQMIRVCPKHPAQEAWQC
jgi:hypothetical protein